MREKYSEMSYNPFSDPTSSIQQSRLAGMPSISKVVRAVDWAGRLTIKTIKACIVWCVASAPLEESVVVIVRQHASVLY